MFGDKEDKNDDRPVGGQPAAVEGLEVTPPTMDEATREPEKQAPPPPPGRGAAGKVGGSYGRNHVIFLAIGIAILILLVVAASAALGFALGRHHDVVRRPGGLMRRGFMNGPGTGRLRQQLKNFAGGGEVSIVRGNVATVEGGNVTIQTPSGHETVVVTDSTKFGGAGLTNGQGGASSLKAGEQVTVLAKKTADGKLEAVMVRVTAPNK